MSKIGGVVLKLFHSTFKLEIPLLAPKEGVLGDNSLI
jgi:hypothetical protein